MTTQLVLVTASQSVATALQESDFDEIAAAMIAGGEGKIQWIGPLPRVTRFFSAVGNNEVWVSWLGQLPSATPQAANDVGSSVSARLHEISSSWSVASVFDYRPDISGPESFWSSGQAASTITSHGENRTNTVMENPYGPNDVVLEVQHAYDQNDEEINRRNDQQKPLWQTALPYVAVFALGAWGLSRVASSVEPFLPERPAKTKRKRSKRA